MTPTQSPGNLTGDAYVEQCLAKLRPVPPRDAHYAALGRVAFLAQARSISHEISQPGSVSKSHWQRLIQWMQTISAAGNWRGSLPGPRQTGTKILIYRKDYKPMFSTLATVVVALTLIFGSAGATALAAQDSLPNEALYGVKTLTEDLRLQTTTQTQNRFSLELAFAARRMGEIDTLAQAGQPLGEALVNRLASHYENALRLAAGMTGGEQIQALGQLTTRLRQHEQTLTGLENSHPAEGLLTQTRLRLQDQLHLAEDGLENPQMLQQQLRTRQQNRIHQQDGTPEPGTTPGSQAGSTPVHNGPGQPQETQAPGNLNQNQNQNQDQNGKGSDNGNCDTCDANQGGGGDGRNGPGDGSGSGGGNNDDAPEHNGPGDGSGNGGDGPADGGGNNDDAPERNGPGDGSGDGNPNSGGMGGNR
jgi:hypothetical protein